MPRLLEGNRASKSETMTTLNAKEKMQLKEAIRRACIKFGYHYVIDRKGHVMTKGWSRNDRENERRRNLKKQQKVWSSG